MADLAQQGIASFIAKMPFDLAILSPNAADQILKDYPDIQDWYIGGHSFHSILYFLKRITCSTASTSA